jgi:hypothetical protein
LPCLALLEFLDDASLLNMQMLSLETKTQINAYLATFLSESMGFETQTKKGLEFMRFIALDEENK